MRHSKNEKMLNYEVRWKNFRCFPDTGWLTIRPLTILIGPNNSGKTSIISPFLMLTQTVFCQDPFSPVIARGPLVDVGNFRNIIFNHKLNLDVYFGIRFRAHDPDKSIKKIGTYPPGGLELEFAVAGKKQACILKSYAVQDMYKRPYVKRELLPNKNYSLKGIISVQKMKPAERKALRHSRPVNFLFDPSRDLNELAKLEKPNAPPKIKLSDEFQHYLSAIGYAQSGLLSMLDNVLYIGPLRDRPKRFYEVLGEDIRTVGPTGERAAHLLHSNYKKFQRSIDHWIQEFEMGQKLQINDFSENVFDISFTSAVPKSTTNIADAGFGASQVLPLITQAVVAPRDSLTLAEQPEIHLNPRLQCVLADLFVEMATNRRRVLVETHSEHLILRLRRLVAMGKIRHTDVALYFVERDKGKSTIKLVPIQKNGHIEAADWPSGFFGETLRESLALATAQAQK